MDQNKKRSNWIVAICQIKFDIDEGQLLQWIQPTKTLTQEEEKDLSLLSFPDSNSFPNHEGSLKYIFRMRRMSSDAKFSLGYTFFTQKKDPKNPRGFSQNSIVILTNFPLISFFYSLLDIIVEQIKDNITTVLMVNLPNFLLLFQSAYEQIMQWPTAFTCQSYKLNLFQKFVYVEIPYYIEAAEPISESENTCSVNINDSRERGQYQEANLFNVLTSDKINLLPKLWELTLTNQPFMIVTDSPDTCCETVLGCISLISPLTYTGDYRPYFTIYDREFQLMQQELENAIVRSIVIGVTNPFFLKTFKNFPVIVRLDRSFEQEEQIDQNINAKQSSNYILTQKKINIGLDKSLSRMFMPVKNYETQIINNSLIKKMYRNLTQEFIGMFEMYFAQQQNVLEHYITVIQEVKKFNEKEFLELVKVTKLSFTELFENKQKILKLYENFIRSANFLSYVQERGNVYFSKGNLMI